MNRFEINRTQISSRQKAYYTLNLMNDFNAKKGIQRCNLQVLFKLYNSNYHD